MDLDTVLKEMTASEQSIEKVAEAPTQDKLTAALKKTASDPAASPVQDESAVNSLFKMAEQIAGTEKDAEVAHAAMLGSAFADSAITKFASYKLEADQIMAKSASPVQPDAAALQKAAQQGYEQGQKETLAKMAQAPQTELEKVSEDDLVKAAAELGYQETLEKAAAEYKQGHDEALQEVHNVASNEFLKGAAEANILIDQARKKQLQFA